MDRAMFSPSKSGATLFYLSNKLSCGLINVDILARQLGLSLIFPCLFYAKRYHNRAMPHTNAPSKIKLMDWSRLRTELLWAYEGLPLSPHFHAIEVDTVMCWLLLKGSVTAQSPTCGQVTAKAGQWLFVAMDKTAHDFSHDALIISLRLVIHWPTGQPLYNHHKWICFESSEHPQLLIYARKLIKQAERIVKMSPDPQHNRTRIAIVPCDFEDYLALENATLRWAHYYNRAMQKLGIKRMTITPMDVRVSECLKFLEQLPMDRQFDEKQLARSLGLSLSQLNRIFVQAMDCTPKSYAETLRLNDTIKLLATTPIPLKELAFTMGFKQPSHFASWFKKKTGLYPKEYRQQQHDDPMHQQMIDALKSG